MIFLLHFALLGPLPVYTSSGYLSLPRFSFVRYSSSFSLLSSFHGHGWRRPRQSQGVVVLPRSPRLRVFVRLEESAGAHCPSLSPVSAPFLRNARHFLPFAPPCRPMLLFLPKSPLAPPLCCRLVLLPLHPFRPFLFFFLRSPDSPSFAPRHPLCLFFIWVIWPRANTTFRRPPTAALGTPISLGTKFFTRYAAVLGSLVPAFVCNVERYSIRHSRFIDSLNVRACHQRLGKVIWNLWNGF